MRGRLAVAVQLATQLDGVADQMEGHVAEYVEAMEDVSAGNLAIIARLALDPSQLEEAETYVLTMRALARTARESLAELSTLTDSMRELAKLSGVLRAPTSKLVGAIGELSRATAAMDQWDRRLQELGVPMPPPDWEPPEEEPAGDRAPQD